MLLGARQARVVGEPARRRGSLGHEEVSRRPAPGVSRGRPADRRPGLSGSVRLPPDEGPLAVLHQQIDLVLRLTLALVVERERAGDAREGPGRGDGVADGVAVGAGLLDRAQDDAGGVVRRRVVRLGLLVRGGASGTWRRSS